MLAELRRRLGNDEATERAEVTEQLAQITGAAGAGAGVVSVSTHVLDAVLGRPAAGVGRPAATRATTCVAEGVTDADGRCRLTEEATTARAAPAGVRHRRRGSPAQGRETFWPEVVLTFAVRDPAEHHHVPLLLAPVRLLDLPRLADRRARGSRATIRSTRSSAPWRSGSGATSTARPRCAWSRSTAARPGTRWST